jgi:hypothetical protein
MGFFVPKYFDIIILDYYIHVVTLYEFEPIGRDLINDTGDI